jgi:hypothetical protein
MDMSHLKTQIMTMFMMKSAPGSGSGDIYTIVYSMLLMNFVEWLFRSAPAVFSSLQTFAAGYWKPRKDAWLPLQDKSRKEKELLNSISMTRVFTSDADKQDKVTNPFVEKVDAVIDFLCSLDNAKHVKMDTRYTLNSTEEIDLTPMLKARVKETAGSDEDSTLEIMIYSSVLKVSEIRQWIDEIHANYVFEKNNKLGNRTYYFNEVPVEPVSQVEIDPNGGPPKQSYRWDTMPKQLLFSMNEFNTSKSFANVYGHHVDELKERLDLFVQHPEWYRERGIPHSLGILLHGVPGAGKTSTIKAIAKDTHRHIFNLSLRPYTSQRQLTHLFFNETVVVAGADGGKQTLKIPLNRRVYVIEDIDCLTDVVLDRTIRGDKTTAQKDGDAVTLSFLLNLLDGVLETPGRILVITSNFPDKLDRALVRPGRIDVTIEFRNTTRAFILDMVNKFYSEEYEIDDVPTELEGIFTPAEVMESLCTHFKNPEAALDHMVGKIEAKVASKQGSSLELLTRGPVASVAPVAPVAPVAMLFDEVVKAEESTADSERPVIPTSPVADPPLSNEIVHSRPVAAASVARRPVAAGKPAPDYAAMKTPVKLPPSFESTWSTADFGDVEFQGGHVPGDFGVRSTVDLNAMR